MILKPLKDALREGDNVRSERSSFLAEVKSSDNCGRLLCNMGQKLGEIFRAEIDPISIMVEDDLLTRFYGDLVPLQQANAHSADWVRVLGHQIPGMKILEVGAGIGGTTGAILQELGGASGKKACFSSYDFTDVSPAFLEKAKDRFLAWGDLIKYGKLDIEKEPSSQGYEAGSYDLVVASNVLHATARIQRTLENVKQLLKPGGKLLLIEITRRKLTQTLVFGPLKGRKTN